MRDSLRRLASFDQFELHSGTMRQVNIELIDGSLFAVEIDRKSKGIHLLDKVCDHLGIQERGYFGLLHAFKGDPRVWIDLNRRISKTFKKDTWDARLAVRFYPPEPTDVNDEIARDQILFAVKRDLFEGRLTCSFVTHALLASYILQSELGDFEDHFNKDMLSQLHVAPSSVMTDELEEKIYELYLLHKGQNPAQAVLNYLENAKKLSLYGAELHCVRDSDEIDLLLAICHSGIGVYRDGILMNRFPWAKIVKISYNKRSFTLKMRPNEFEDYTTVVTFKLGSTTNCKKLWKCAVESHIFFRRATPVTVKRVPLLGFGSRRLSCRRTLRQMRAEPMIQEITA